eukprot:scaffold44472_cov54-Attheya_sp.AAC.2
MGARAQTKCIKYLTIHLLGYAVRYKHRGNAVVSNKYNVVPLVLHGVTSYFPTRKPTEEEWVNCRQFEITAEGPEWDLHDSQFGEQENALLDNSGRLRDFGDRLRRNRRFLSSIDSQNSRLRA